MAASSSRSAMVDSTERETFRYIAQLAMDAKRYDDMVEAMKNVAKMDVELTKQERYLLSLGSKNVIDSKRASLRTLSSIKQKEKSKGDKQNVKWIKEYRKTVVSQLTDNCNDIMAVIDEHVLPACTDGDSSVFYYKMKGDYYRYLAEFKTGADRKEVADHALKAYETATTTANAELEPAHPIRLGLALNFSTFYYEIMNAPERACHIAKEAYVEAIEIEDDHINDESYSIKDSGSILQLLRGNLSLWTCNISDDGDSDEVDGAKRNEGGEDATSSSQPMKQVDSPLIFSAVKQPDA